jgi:glycosyltransferase involved in cell wall biosynthesis
MNGLFIQDVATLFHAQPFRYAGVGGFHADALSALEQAGLRFETRQLLDADASQLAGRLEAVCKSSLPEQPLSLLSVAVGIDTEALAAAAPLLSRQGADLVHLHVPVAAVPDVIAAMQVHGYDLFRDHRSDEASLETLFFIELIFHAESFARRNPCCLLFKQLFDAQRAVSESRRELKLSNSRLDQVVGALRNERAIYQKQIWKTSKRIKGQLSYRLGSAIVTGSESLKGSLKLPRTLLTEYRAYKQEREQVRQLSQSTEQARQLADLFKQQGYHGLVAHIEGMTPVERKSLDDDSFGHYVGALSNARQFEKCVAEFDLRYPPAALKRPPEFAYPLIRAYVRSLLRLGRAEDADVLLTELVRRYPHHADYSSLLGYVLAGHKPTLARSTLRTAIMLGSRTAHTDAILLYRTLLLEKQPLKEAWSDVVNVLDQMSHHKFAMEAMDYLQSTMKLEQGRGKEALRSLNEAMTRNRLGPIALWKSNRPFGIDNFTVPLCEPGSYRGPLVSVLMTTHNSEEFLDTAIRSVLEQTYADLELIVVDDCSTDRTRQKLAAWAAFDQRVVVLHNKHNVGTYGSKNLALLKARGKFITCHDSDDWSHPQKIAFQVMRLRKSKAMACYSRWVRIDERGYFEATRWGQLSHANPSSLLYHRSVIDAIGFYDMVRTGADTEFQHRIINRFGAQSVFETPTTMSFGRAHSASLTRSSRFGFDEYGASPYRQAYWNAWGEWHLRAMKESPARLFIDFPPKGDTRVFEVPPEIAVPARVARLNVEALL